MACTEYDWLDYLLDESLFGCMFVNEECEDLLECDNDGPGGMDPASGATEQDTVDHRGKIDLPFDCNLPNCQWKYSSWS